MLALTRKVDQSVKIGEDIEIMVVSITKNAVTLGFRAPESIPIIRKEITERKRHVGNNH